MACKTGHGVHILSDMNICTYPESRLNFNHGIERLNEIYIDFKLNFSIVQVNTELTRHAPHQESSLVDHILTNKPSLISKICTIPNLMSDHCVLTCQLNFTPEKIEPKFKNIQN